MPRKPRQTPPPSYRNLQIYHELAYEGRRQIDVAAMFDLAQCRVSQIARSVRAWVDRILPIRHCKHDLGARFHIAIARERLRLHAAHDPLIELFTTGDEFPRYLRRYVAIVDGLPVETVEITEQPNFRLLNEALNANTRLAELEAIANRGPYADLATQSHQTVIRRLSSTTANPTNASENCGRGVLKALPPLPSQAIPNPCHTVAYDTASPP